MFYCCGQQQSVAIKHAVSSDPMVLLFNEATSQLGPELVRKVANVIRELVSKE